jgi:hypothetical protein
VSFPLFGFFYMQRQEMYFVRWLVPFLPPMAVLAAETAHVLVRQIIRRMPGRSVNDQSLKNNYLPLGIIALLTLPSIYMAYQADRIFSGLDTRSEALAWIRQNIPPGSGVAAEVLSPPWGPPLAMPGLSLGPYNFAPIPDGGVAEVELQQYYDWGVKYVVASSYHYNRQLRDKKHQAQLAERMQTLDDQAELIAFFQPYQMDYNGYFYHDQVFGPANDTLFRSQPGPIIKVYRLP